MQLTIGTDYMIRVVVYLATIGRRASSSEISKQMGIPPDYLRAIAAPLRESGIVASYKGGSGGYELDIPPEKISLLDIVSIGEGTMKINRCLEHDRFCSRFATEDCPVRSCYIEVQTLIEQALAAVSIDRIIEGSAA